ncbi:nickel pincer cofactor biosynthesis protein LarC [Leptothermofonsia sp. ETS-13]|uniref:nickel pincer cofactor biosynthesis protein LarC n=1 Tax=Leptothermofonsia sp. ETS-13 TaxID=3035696 RepID=UPI003B9FE8B7
MTKIAYLECPTGIAGDMCLGALVDAGVPLDYLVETLGCLGISKEYRLQAERVHRNGQQATKVHVDLVLPLSEEEFETQEATSAPTAYHPWGHYHAHAALEQEDFEHGPAPDLFHSHSHPHIHDRTPGSSTNSHSHSTASRHLPEIERMILAAGLPSKAEVWSLSIFRQLAEAEGAVHGIPPDQVHFHEVGATDAIVDIVGTCLGLDWLGIDKIYCSALPVGGGTIRAAHGRLPVPAPAVLKLFELRQIPLYSNGIERELVTPTGAAIATTLATQFGPPPSMTLLRVGLGAGSIELPIPNILRLWIGERGKGKGVWDWGLEGERRKGKGEREKSEARSQEPGARGGEWEVGRGKMETQNSELVTQNLSPHPLIPPSPHPPHFPTSHSPLLTETIAVLETQIDDLNPQAIGYLYDVLFAAGALDVFTQAIGMKKSRPGILLTVICHPEAAIACETILFRETTTLGIRRSIQHRQILHREIQQVQTSYGSIRVKVAWADETHESTINVQPEYEDCAQIARQRNLSWREVHRLALQAWYGKGGGVGE